MWTTVALKIEFELKMTAHLLQLPPSILMFLLLCCIENKRKRPKITIHNS